MPERLGAEPARYDAGWAQAALNTIESGHHLQIGQAVYNAALLNRWQRLLCECSAHAEGWALHSERLMGELGFLDDPGERLGMPDALELRAARVVLDIGVHLDVRT
jgi:uncharacterized protein (DUF885 family)